MIGVVFADEGEAKTFFKKVMTTKLGTGQYFDRLSLLCFTTPRNRESKVRQEEEEIGERRQD